MAIIAINTPDTIEFRTNIAGAPKDPIPYVTIQLGIWELKARTESGIIIDAGGSTDYPPVLSANDARKLAKWLNKAADELDGVISKKNTKKKHYNQDEEDDDGMGGYKF